MRSAPEPEWDGEQRGLVLALAELAADTCPGCQGALSQTSEADAEGAYRVTTTRCHKCTAIAAGAAEFKDATHNHALLYSAERMR